MSEFTEWFEAQHGKRNDQRRGVAQYRRRSSRAPERGQHSQICPLADRDENRGTGDRWKAGSMNQKTKRMARFLTPSVPSDMQNMPFSLVGRGRLELPTNGLKVLCAHGARVGIPSENCAWRARFARSTSKFLTPTRRGFDSLHPLHLSPRQISVFPCESQREPSTDGRGIGHGFTFFLHRFCGASA